MPTRRCARSRHAPAKNGRAARRWALLGAATLAATAIPLAPVVAPTAAADDCPDAEVVFARGTDEPAGMGRVGDALVDSLRQQTPGMVVRAYAVNYKATITQRHSGEGAKDAINHIKSTIAECPDTKIVLAAIPKARASSTSWPVSTGSTGALHCQPST